MSADIDVVVSGLRAVARDVLALELRHKSGQPLPGAGLGVGLVLVKRIMERFGGSVSLDSSEGEGTSVRLNFKSAPGERV